MKRVLLIIVGCVSLGSAVLASGLSGPGSARPWSVEGGLFDPTWSGASTGGYFAIGRVFWGSGPTEYGLESHSANYKVGIVTITTPTLNFFGRFYNQSCTAFFMAAVGVGKATATLGPFSVSGSSTTVFTVGGGMMTGPYTYAIARVQTSSVTAFKGFSLGYGYRF